MSKHFLITLTLLSALAVSLFAAKDPIRFGNVSKEELKQDVCPIDSSAEAMVLCNYGEFRGDDFSFVQTRRLKILKKDGTNRGNIFVYGADNANVRGFTFNLVDGKVEKTRLKNKSVFRERVTSHRYRYRIAMPNVKKGSVVDVEIRYNGLPSNFYFQEDIPVMHSELMIYPSQYVDFRQNFVGFEPLETSEPNHFVAKNMPAFKEEPYITSRENYITKMELDLLKISFPGHYESFTTDWKALRKRLMEAEYFGQILRRSNGYLSDLEEKISKELGEDAPDLEKTKAAYEAIKKVKWNGDISLTPNHNMLGSVFKDGTGNSAEINFMLLHLLERLDIKASPVVMSTRSHGILNPFFPSLDKLNYVIVCANIDGKNHLMDPSDELMPFGMLPNRCINGKGRLVNEEKTISVNLNPGGKEKSVVVYNLKMTPEGHLKGTRGFQGTEYAAYKFRKRFRRHNNEDDIKKSLKEDYPNLEVDSMDISNLKETDKSLKANYEINLKNQVTVMDTLGFLNPFCLEKIADNPFKVKDRKYPVDFAYKRSKSVVVRIQLPENASISEIPQPQKIILPGNSAAATILYQGAGNILTVQYQMQINKTMFLPEEYPYLQKFYDEIIKKQEEPVVLTFNY
ncbi:hypothetical protein [Marinilabilia rubra]|uniref:DUF3857 domain-containing protein n=1 Tax=Marinilabilia rubra TaxID=2162893 RepID=A0A2U2BB53_9BACT|nr:hypothetical protein [Marinilabilia rubra]PWE00291.1 hypothetical protein DDZ16_04945 [Marinilabilia rubra]